MSNLFVGAVILALVINLLGWIGDVVRFIVSPFI